MPRPCRERSATTIPNRHQELPAKLVDAMTSAQEAGLRYVSDYSPGFRRERQGESFRYLRPDGDPVEDEETLRRIRALAIPPAWTEVWICPDPRGHLQATGRDARRRKQYRYHGEWRAVRDQDKYGRLISFASALPAIRARIATEMKRHGLPREKVLATVIRLLDTTKIRVGNETYARENQSFGLTTMRRRHVQIKRSGAIRFFFRGKGGKEHEVEIADARIAKVIRSCQDLPGQELFQYVDDDGERRRLDSDAVNHYLREISGDDFTAKDFRTWAGTVHAAQALQEFERCENLTQAKKNIGMAIEAVARLLGNTRTICRKCYIHPTILETYLDGTMATAFGRSVKKTGPKQSSSGLRADEAAVLAFLQHGLKRKQRETQDSRQAA